MGKLKLKVSARLMRKKIRKKQRTFSGKKQCRFCTHPDQGHMLDYKNLYMLRGFITERGKILPLRVSGNCFFHQRALATQIKIARTMALLPYCPLHQ